MSEGSDPGLSSGDDLGAWVDAVGDVTIPLFAGFSVSSVIVVSDGADHFRFPGPTILVLGIASILLIGAVQCAYHARMYFKRHSRPALSQGRWWGTGTRIFYHSGIVGLLVGLGLALAPLSDKGINSGLRWWASGMAFAASLAEVGFIFERWRSRTQESNGRS